MSVSSSRVGFTALTLLGIAGSCAKARESGAPALTVPDSAATATAALDTLRRLGAKDYVVDSLVRRGDTAMVWVGPRVWMATDRPTSVVSVIAPAHIVAVRQIFGG